MIMEEIRKEMKGEEEITEMERKGLIKGKIKIGKENRSVIGIYVNGERENS